jgi:hypothetical protein
MIKKYDILDIQWVSLVQLKDIILFMSEQYQLGRKLIGYDFFTYIPQDWILPCLELSTNFSESNMSEEEKVGYALIKIFNWVNLRDFYQTIDRKDIKIFRQEWLKYLDGEKTEAIIGCEFIYEDVMSKK